MKSNSYTNIRKSVIVHIPTSEKRLGYVLCTNLISQIPQIRNLVSFLF